VRVGRTMLIDLQYRDDGFRVDVTLTSPEEQALSDVQIARDVWWPARMSWLVFPVLALPSKRNPPRIPAEQKWTLQRMPSSLTKADAMEMVRLHNQNARPDTQLAEAQLAQIARSWNSSPEWILARIDFPE
jgi:hypothetical protein